MRKFDPSIWNLAVPVGAFALGCGPLVPIDGETDTDPTDPTTNPSDPSDPSDPSSPSDPSNPTDPTGDQCPEVPCPPGYYCSYNQCVPDYYCTDYCCYDDGYGGEGCCYGDDCCYGEGCWYDCYGLTECGYAAFCEGYGYCNAIPVPLECGDDPQTTFTPILPSGGSLAFVDMDGDAALELVVADGDAVTVVQASATTAVVPTGAGGGVSDVDAGDLDADGDEDIVAANGDGTIRLILNSAGSFAVGGTVEVGYTDAVDIADFDGNGTADLLIGQGTGIPPRLWLGLPGLAFQPASEFEVYSETVAHDNGQIDGASASDVVVQDYDALNIWLGDGSPGGGADIAFYEQYGIYGVEIGRVTTGDFDGDGIEDVARSLYWGGFSLVDSWQGGSFAEMDEWGYPSYSIQLAAGDLNGDGSSDLVMATEDYLGVRYGTTAFNGFELFGCFEAYGEAGGALRLATGDFDGNGRDDVAMSSPGGVFMFSRL